MSNPNFNVFDTVIGDRVLNAAALSAILAGGSSPGTFSDLQSTTLEVTGLGTFGDVQTATLEASGLSTTAQIKVDTGTKTATAVAGAATLNKSAGVITSEALTTAAGATYTLTLTDSAIAAADQVFASVNLGAGTGGTPCVASVTPGAGSVVIVIQNIHASAAFNAAIKIAFAVLKN